MTTGVDPNTNPAQDAGSKPDPAPKPETVETFPREYVEDLRAENAKWRTQLRDLQGEFEKLKTAQDSAAEAELQEQSRFKELYEKEQQKVADLSNQLKTQQANFVRMKIANEFDLPDVLAERLRGDDEDALREDAKALAALVAKPAPDATPDADTDAPSDDGAPDGTDAAPAETPPQETPPEPARRQQATTAVPGGPPVGRTDSDRRNEYFAPNVDSPIFAKK